MKQWITISQGKMQIAIEVLKSLGTSAHNIVNLKNLTQSPLFSKLTKDYQVRYLNFNERKKFEVSIKQGSSGPILMRQGKAYNTENKETAFSGRGYAIFVFSPNKKIYSDSHIVGQFHHSSFLRKLLFFC